MAELYVHGRGVRLEDSMTESGRISPKNKVLDTYGLVEPKDEASESQHGERRSGGFSTLLGETVTHTEARRARMEPFLAYMLQHCP